MMDRNFWPGFGGVMRVQGGCPSEVLPIGKCKVALLEKIIRTGVKSPPSLYLEVPYCPVQ